MSKKYCKKSSMQAIADEVKTRKGSSANIQGSQIATDIGSLLIPVQRGSVNKELKTNDASYSILKGVYNAGSVYVDPQEITTPVQPSTSQQTIKDANNKPLKKVVVAALDNYQIAYGYWSTSSSNPTSITISGLPFTPSGIAIVKNVSSSTKYDVISVCVIDGLFYGYAVPYSTLKYNKKLAPIYSGSYVTTNNSVTISNIRCNDVDQGIQNCSFMATTYTTNPYTYFIWGK